MYLYCYCIGRRGGENYTALGWRGNAETFVMPQSPLLHLALLARTCSDISNASLFRQDKYRLIHYSRHAASHLMSVV